MRNKHDEIAARKTLDASGALVIPGLIQCHVHVVQSLLRHQADGMELLDWLETRTWPYEAALDGDGVQAAAELGVAELLTGGTTTVLDFGTTHDHDRVFQVAEALGIRMISGKTHMDDGDAVPPFLLEDRDASIGEAEALGRRWHHSANGRLGYAVTPRFALSCTKDLLDQCVTLARDNGWLLHTHASENIGEIDEVRRRFGMNNIDYLDSVGLTGADVILAHGIHLVDEEKERLAATQTRICHCPGANLKLASGIADIPGLLELGVPIGLGADGAPCNNRLSIFHEMALAGTLHTLRHGPTGRCGHALPNHRLGAERAAQRPRRRVAHDRRRGKDRRRERGYLLRNASAGRLNYGLAREQQLPIGSGIIESTVRRVLNLRMKGASIFWTKDNAEDMILLRAYYKSGLWQVLENNALTATCQLTA